MASAVAPWRLRIRPAAPAPSPAPPSAARPLSWLSPIRRCSVEPYSSLSLSAPLPARPPPLARDGLRAGPELRQHRAHDALLLLDQREQQVLGLHGLVALLVGRGLGRRDRLLRLDRQLVESHVISSPSPCPLPLGGGDHM